MVWLDPKTKTPSGRGLVLLFVSLVIFVGKKKLESGLHPNYKAPILGAHRTLHTTSLLHANHL